MAAAATDTIRYQVTGMDCSSCAAKIEGAARKVEGVADVKVSIASQIMTLQVDEPANRLPLLESAITGLGYQLDRIGPSSDTADGDDDDRIPDLSHVTPAYKRALWIVVLLNVGYGVVEIVGSFLAGSQALQADALDFLGDGMISFLGLVAVGWGLAARAKAALLQGVFLGLLGLGVVASTIYRVFIEHQPESVLMGGFALVAFVVNVLAAVVLIPHRKGDANMRAVWLFSRNDAIGNLAVVAAAGLVWWTGTQWPDLVVAFAVAGLFLQSAWSIIRDARQDLSAARDR
ncbi:MULTISPECIES: cation diffusion facilitator family transporter [Rhizobiaceae]|jgi:Co/Zn/Cd efflux system component/copper chaperone CopZ|uniref:HMA domain-containing protein n=8 Tax=Rhizobiaceae TaxID=82115 RepID=A0A380TKQ7_9HYPH|nr:MULTISPECIES: cation diffusion facilitator family transporter [Rhizobiaceae]CAD6631220.1 cation transporter [arsenite-oxidising bacterium NT-25]MBB5278803.1 Co/Zn/Cd efflux system component/copper chaperone CopZ [Rhizobium rosettiformans]CAD7025829.1 cation transporter [Pseudorhizobium halotolerans]CUX65392.1 Heavy metal transport/detoxification protein [Agrobacterium tomkonis CFBP 6623]SOC48277.1 cation diffusion facilitator family transporter [Rhizobium subbaraonis]|tara:strand:- start:901 stop:1767 length:867 start_codon:yes stop_codon:yes gene_type:complete